MNIPFTLVVLTLTWATCHGQERCCTPPRYEVKVSGTTNAEGRSTQGKFIISNFIMPRLSVDYRRKMVSLQEYIQTGNVVQNLTTIVDYNKGFAYVVAYGRTESCMKVKIPGPMASACIPGDAKYIGSATVGFGRGSFLTDTWYVTRTFARPRGVATVSAVFEREGCIPISEGAASFAEGVVATTGLMFFDFSEGIKDPSVFNLPAICTAAKELDMSHLSGLGGHVLQKYAVNF